MSSLSSPPIIVALGEILWDRFPDEDRFGGAPANFACSVAGLGRAQVRSVMVGAVGNDPLGEAALRELASRGVDISAIERRDEPTGEVRVTLDAAGVASYRFAEPVAWDRLIWTPSLESLVAQADLVAFGTLGQRDPVARRTILRFLDALPSRTIRLLDINLRPPHWTPETVVESARRADWIKLNDLELPVVADLFGIGGSESESAESLLRRLGLRGLALTRGERGSLLIAADGSRSEWPAEAVSIVDTVGAGDAFTAALALGLVHSFPLDAVHRWASRVASHVCGVAGANPPFPASLSLASFQESLA